MAEDDQGNAQGQSLGWRAALPDEFKEHEFVKTFQKPGDFVKSAIEIKTERDALKTKLENTIPKLTDKSTDEEKAVFYKAIGRPDKPEEYEIPEVNGQKNSPEMISWFQKEAHRLGLPKNAAKELSVSFNNFMGGMVKAEMEKREGERKEAETKLKTELGDKYDASVEMARRVWKKLSNAEYDAFVNETKIGNDSRFIRFVLEVAKKTGDDQSIDGMPGKGAKGDPNDPKSWYPYMYNKT